MCSLAVVLLDEAAEALQLLKGGSIQLGSFDSVHHDVELSFGLGLDLLVRFEL